jgi:hypothetical protein
MMKTMKKRSRRHPTLHQVWLAMRHPSRRSLPLASRVVSSQLKKMKMRTACHLCQGSQATLTAQMLRVVRQVCPPSWTTMKMKTTSSQWLKHQASHQLGSHLHLCHHLDSQRVVLLFLHRHSQKQHL